MTQQGAYKVALETLMPGNVVLKAHWQVIDHGTHSEYVIAAHGTLGYGVSVAGEWLVFTDKRDAQEYALLTFT